MARTDRNPFQSEDLYLPKGIRKDVDSVVNRKRKDFPVESSPLYRTVDFWFLAACLAVQSGKAKQTGNGSKGFKFNDGTVLRDSATRIELMELVAIGETGDPKIVTNPTQIVNLFNDWAAIGSTDLLDLTNSGDDLPLRNLVTSLLERTK